MKANQLFLLMSNEPRFAKFISTINASGRTLNQRVQGSSPCAPTKQNQWFLQFFANLDGAAKTAMHPPMHPFADRIALSRGRRAARKRHMLVAGGLSHVEKS
jgi:hypothetical protein